MLVRGMSQVVVVQEKEDENKRKKGKTQRAKGVKKVWA